MSIAMARPSAAPHSAGFSARRGASSSADTLAVFGGRGERRAHRVESGRFVPSARCPPPASSLASVILRRERRGRRTADLVRGRVRVERESRDFGERVAQQRAGNAGAAQAPLRRRRVRRRVRRRALGGDHDGDVLAQRHGARQRLGRREQTLADARRAIHRRRRVGGVGGVRRGGDVRRPRRDARRSRKRARERARRRRRERVAARARTRDLSGRAHEHAHQHAPRTAAVAEGGVAGAERLARRRLRLGRARPAATASNAVRPRCCATKRQLARPSASSVTSDANTHVASVACAGADTEGIDVHGDALHVLGGVRVGGRAGCVVRRGELQPARIGNRVRATSLDYRRPGRWRGSRTRPRARRIRARAR